MVMTEEVTATRSRTITWDDPTAGLPALASMAGLDYLQAMSRGEIPIPPMAALMGFTGFEAGDGKVVFTIDPAEYHYNPLGTVHGGMVATLVDTALGCAVQTKLPAGTAYTTVDLQISFVRPITVDTGRVSCTGEVVRVGRRIGRAIARVEDAEGRLLAYASASQAIITAEPAA